VLLIMMWPVYCVSHLLKKHPLPRESRERPLDPSQIRVRFELERQWDLEDELTDLGFTPDGSGLWTTDRLNPLTIWDPGSGAQLQRMRTEGQGGAPSGGRNLGVSRDGTLLALAAGGSGMIVVDIATDSVKADLPLDRGGEATPCHFGPGNRTLLSVLGGRGPLALWDLTFKRLSLTSPFKVDGFLKQSVAFGPDGRKILVASLDGGEPALIEWGPTEFSVVRSLKGSHGRAALGCFDDSGALSATWSSDGAVSIWDAESGRELEAFAVKDPLRAIAFRPGHPLMLTLAEGGRASLWAVRDGLEVGRLDGEAKAVAFSADGSQLAVQGRSPLPGRDQQSTPVLRIYRLVDLATPR
jgi:WD40 repeat protein